MRSFDADETCDFAGTDCGADIVCGGGEGEGRGVGFDEGVCDVDLFEGVADSVGGERKIGVVGLAIDVDGPICMCKRIISSQ